MEATEIKIGRVYEIKVGKNVVPIRIMKKTEEGGWEAVAISTNNPMIIASPSRILGPHNPKRNKAKKPGQQQTPAEAAKQVLDKMAKPLTPISALDAAVKVLTEAGAPLGCKQMMDTMLAKKYWKPAHSGKTPANTLHAAISAEIKKRGDQARFEKVGKGQFGLRATA